MKKTAVFLALAIGFSITSLNATSNSLTSTKEITIKTYEVSPLCKAVATGNIDLAKTLIEQGADVNAKSNGMSPIHYAAKYNRVEIIKVLLKAGADVHKSCDLGYTALNHAELSKATEAEQFLKRFKKKVSN
ncbi:hypothetical protein BWZ20_05895 [Winogradskyella sp. J14-2]|uniref:ankyrin repeat domain-containing protein n=1 Tax=Winogradskyella sp. J14-2 TaxID=1936080 RepID=UPI0009727978|nr:ankyrin repeat domain-containing protein [Winogradskyella sp. J14-2]APY07858.1 hypothetical protein BWZ20_05895 [Winogradskyella sp. J14-2]